jgi:hypothetical protein
VPRTLWHLSIQFRVSTVLVLSQQYLGLTRTHLSSERCEMFASLVHQLLPEGGVCHNVLDPSRPIPCAARMAKY